MTLWHDKAITAYHNDANYTKLAVRMCQTRYQESRVFELAPAVEFHIADTTSDTSHHETHIATPVLTLEQAYKFREMLGDAIGDANARAVDMSVQSGGDGCYQIICGDVVAHRPATWDKAFELYNVVCGDNVDNVHTIRLVNAAGQTLLRADPGDAVELSDDAPAIAANFRVTIDGVCALITTDWNEAKAQFETAFDPQGSEVVVLSDPMMRPVLVGRPIT